MHRVVAIDQETGRAIDEVVESEFLAWELVRECLGFWPEAAVYVDGHLIPESLAVWLSQGGAPPQMPAPAPPQAPAPSSPPQMTIEPEKIPDFAALVCRFFSDAFQAQIEGLTSVVEMSKKLSALMIERERQHADEAVRQRKLLHQSLADIDLLDRSVAVARFRHIAAQANRRQETNDGFTVGDFLAGLAALGGEKN